MEISGRFVREPAATGSAVISRALLLCGVLSGPFFYVVAIAQILTRPGFDIRRHAISVLSLGDQGWIQIANFAITGLLALAGALGIRWALRGRRAGTWGPVLIGMYGMGLVAGAIFHPDPGLGFPPGAPAGMPTGMSGHAAIHMVAFMVAFVSIIAACFVFSRLFGSIGRRRWVVYCVATGVATPILVVLGSSIASWVGVIFFIAGAVGFGWVSALCAWLYGHTPAADV